MSSTNATHPTDDTASQRAARLAARKQRLQEVIAQQNRADEDATAAAEEEEQGIPDVPVVNAMDTADQPGVAATAGNINTVLGDEDQQAAAGGFPAASPEPPQATRVDSTATTPGRGSPPPPECYVPADPASLHEEQQQQVPVVNGVPAASLNEEQQVPVVNGVPAASLNEEQQVPVVNAIVIDDQGRPAAKKNTSHGFDPNVIRRRTCESLGKVLKKVLEDEDSTITLMSQATPTGSGKKDDEFKQRTINTDRFKALCDVMCKVIGMCMQTDDEFAQAMAAKVDKLFSKGKEPRGLILVDRLMMLVEHGALLRSSRAVYCTYGICNRLLEIAKERGDTKLSKKKPRKQNPDVQKVEREVDEAFCRLTEMKPVDYGQPEIDVQSVVRELMHVDMQQDTLKRLSTVSAKDFEKVFWAVGKRGRGDMLVVKKLLPTQTNAENNAKISVQANAAGQLSGRNFLGGMCHVQDRRGDGPRAKVYDTMGTEVQRVNAEKKKQQKAANKAKRANGAPASAKKPAASRKRKADEISATTAKADQELIKKLKPAPASDSVLPSGDDESSDDESE